MHFKNGREAANSDPVVCKDYNGKITSGVIHSLRDGRTCNCDVAVPIPGGAAQLTCQDVNQMYHAEDAFNGIDKLTLEAQAAAKAAEAAGSDAASPQPESSAVPAAAAADPTGSPSAPT